MNRPGLLQEAQGVWLRESATVFRAENLQNVLSKDSHLLFPGSWRNLGGRHTFDDIEVKVAEAVNFVE